MYTEAAAASHVGNRRAVNEDSYLSRPNIALVADGMGGHACGDVASALTVSAFVRRTSQPILASEDISAAISDANKSIVHESSINPEKAGMGTTASGVALIEQGGQPHWLVFNVGDSRVYRIEGVDAQRLTVDHSEVSELVALGRIAPEQALRHPLRHVITRSLGMSPAPDADTWILPAEGNELFLVCSDGLTDELSDLEIGSIAGRHEPLEKRAVDLVAAAVQAGGRDNVTAVLISSHESGDPDGESRTLPREGTTQTAEHT